MVIQMRQDLLELYAGSRRKLPDELTWIVLELAGMCGRGRRSSFYWIYT